MLKKLLFFLFLVSTLLFFYFFNELKALAFLPFSEAGTSLSSLWLILGEDHLGRSYLARLIFAGFNSLYLSFFLALSTLFLGAFLGILAAYKMPIAAPIIHFLFKFLMSFPYIPMLVILLGLNYLYLEDSFFVIKLATYSAILIFISWPPIMQIIYGKVCLLRKENYFKASRLLGSSIKERIYHHLLPNLSPLLWQQFAISFAQFMVLDTTLNYLALGPGEPLITLGGLMNDAQARFLSQPWPLLYPAFILFSFCFIAYSAKK